LGPKIFFFSQFIALKAAPRVSKRVKSDPFSRANKIGHSDVSGFEVANLSAAV
jgi:hypothetical protein